MLGLRRTPRSTHNDPCSPGRLILGRGYWTRLFCAGAPSIGHVVASPYLGGRVHLAVPPNYPLTDRLQFDILQSGPGWWGPNAIRSIETAQLHHAARRRGGCVAAGGARACMPPRWCRKSAVSEDPGRELRGLVVG